MTKGGWGTYYDAVKGEPPHRTLLDALGLMELGKVIPSHPFAVDFGCGSGRDTLELLRRGWKVVAVDGEALALDRLKESCPPEWAASLQTVVSTFEDAELPECDLINASLSLPFVRPDRFDRVWEKIVRAIRPDGWFCGHFFGIRDEWAGRPDITVHADDEVRAFLSRFEIKSFSEKEEDGKTATNTPKHWHRYSVVARKKSQNGETE